jgi:hypothetical protein
MQTIAPVRVTPSSKMSGKRDLAKMSSTRSVRTVSFQGAIPARLEEYEKSDREGYSLKGKLWGLMGDFLRFNTRSVGGFCSTLMTGSGAGIAALGLSGFGLPAAAIGIGMSLFGLMTAATVARCRLYDTP